MAELLYLVASATFFLFMVVSYFLLPYHPVKYSFLSALLLTSLWSGMSAFGPGVWWHFIELARDLSWIWLLIHLLNPTLQWSNLGTHIRRGVTIVTVLFSFLLLIDVYQSVGHFIDGRVFFLDVWAYQYIFLSIAGLVLVEQLLRNTDAEFLWAVKLLSISIAAQFVYDIVLYSSTLLSSEIDPLFWNARALFVLVLIPLMWLSMIRISNRKSKVVISRYIAFHSVSLIGVGAYMLVMAAIGYYIQYAGGAWGGIIQIAFLGLALLMLIVLIFSGQVRATLRVFINKHFFAYKYDYRDEWLRFMDSFSVSRDEVALEERIILSVADIVDSTGGLLWIKNGNDYVCDWGCNREHLQELNELNDGGLIQFMVQTGWVVDVREYRESPARYDGLALPSWLVDDASLRLLIPVIHQGDMIAILALDNPRAGREFNWEDRDLLKTVSQQAAGYLTLMSLSQELHEAKQFEAFNRLSAYVVHDLKNVVAQLSLVVSNGKKYRTNPAFVDDAFDTVENAVNRMNKMLSHLRHDRSEMVARASCIDLVEILKQVAKLRTVDLPVPTLQLSGLDSITINADKERLSDVLLHLVQNAQEATEDSGRVELILQQESTTAKLMIRDNGCGMSAEFLRNKLFKPFATTKGNAGMGIGVYEAKEYIQSIKGSLRVDSELGVGTCFEVVLPLQLISESKNNELG